MKINEYFDTYNKFLGYIPKNLKRRFLILIPLLSLSGILEVLSIAALIPIMNLLVGEADNLNFLSSIITMDISNSNFIIYFLLSYVLLITLKGVYVFLVSRFSFKTSLQIKAFFQKLLFSSYLHREYMIHLNSNSSNYIRNLTIECNNVEGRLVMPLIVLLSELLPSIGIILFLLYINPFGVLLTGIIFILVGFGISFLTSAKLKQYSKNQIKSDGLQIKVAKEAFASFREIQLYKKQNNVVDLYTNFVDDSINSNFNALSLGQIPRLILEIVGIIVIFIIAGISLFNGSSTPQVIVELTLFVVAIVKLLPSVNKIVISIQTITYSKPTLENILDELTTISKISLNNNKVSSVNTFNSVNEIEITDLSFKYKKEDKNIFESINLKFQKGDIIGIRGESGSGKSTLINLLLGFLKPSSGSILADSQDIENSISAWQSKISYVPQEVILFDDTIKNNIIFYDDEIRLIDIEKILKELKLESLVNDSIEGLETFIGEDGSFLSGGQKQRIGIARAIVRKPALIIFDEATSAVDMNTENEINKVIKSISDDCIVIIIAHKNSAFINCNKIYKIENNKLIIEKE